MIYYLDTSALIKRYLDEIGSSWMRGLAQAASSDLLISSRLTTVEISSAFARRLREGTVTKEDYADHLAVFDEDCNTLYHLVELSPEILDLARDLTARHPLRALDALQLASALLANRVFLNLNLPSLTFVSADDRLLETAQQENLPIYLPNGNP
ncbi:MAG: type II toxin-antitoxin system VapC family toxin [Chloroflexi bacterium]|nr:type II toxin-antitoxin system VapC family toxin [Chloroflexota bacterium]